MSEPTITARSRVAATEPGTDGHRLASRVRRASLHASRLPGVEDVRAQLPEDLQPILG